MAYGAPTVVDAPERVAAPFGLFSVLSFRPAGEGRWQNGAEWESLSCGPASGIGEPECEPTEEGFTSAIGLPKGDAESAENGDASAFTVYFKEFCSPTGRIEDAQDRAAQSLLAKEQQRVEQALWTGDLGNVPNFITPESVIGSTDPAVVLGEVTKAIRRDYGSMGVIHVGLVGAATLFAHDLLVVRGERVYSVLGEPVVIGAGYLEEDGNSGTGPADTGNVWMIGTPSMFGYRSEIFPDVEAGQIMDRGVNNAYGIAERSYLIGWDDCGVVAAQFTAGV